MKPGAMSGDAKLLARGHLTTATRPDPKPLSADIVKKIAMDIGKEVAAHIETMYPNAITATSPNMLISVRNCVYNEIIAAIAISDEDEIAARLESRRVFRREQRAAWRKIRQKPDPSPPSAVPVVGRG